MKKQTSAHSSYADEEAGYIYTSRGAQESSQRALLGHMDKDKGKAAQNVDQTSFR